MGSTAPSPVYSIAVPLPIDMPPTVMRAQMPCNRRPAKTPDTQKRISELPRHGEDFDFDGIYRKYSRGVFTLCLRMVRNREEAEDLTHDTFVRLILKIDTFRGESAFRTWLFRFVTNVVLMHLRKKRRQETMEDPLENGAEMGEAGNALHSLPSATDPTLAGAIDRVVLDRAIQQLAPGFRAVFLLHAQEGCSHNEIGARLGMGPSTSKSQLHKARRHLRLLLQEARSDGQSAFSHPSSREALHS
jgi:RNA polymerase sigma-70 factor (ECF subfamily)